MTDTTKLVIYTAVLKIVRDLMGRGGLGDEWDNIDEEIREEIITKWRDIIIAELEGRV